MISSRALLFVRSGIHPGEIAIIFRAQGSGQNWSPRNPAQAPYVKPEEYFRFWSASSFPDSPGRNAMPPASDSEQQ
jgi:hypothetical protein